MNVYGIDFVMYEVSDLNLSVKFYQEVLGLDLTWKEDSFQWAEFNLQQTTLALYAPRNMEHRDPNLSGTLFLAVDNVHESLLELKGKGVTVLFGPIDTPVCEMGAVLDPDGNRVGLHHRKDGSVG